MPTLEETVAIEITTPLPEEGYVDITYRIEGIATVAEKVAPPPWLYAEARLKEWYKPEAIEEVSYLRGFPIPVTGKFSIDFKPEKLGAYEVTVVATPAPLPLPAIGVPPITGRSDVMKFRTVERPAGEYTGLRIVSYEIVSV